MWTWFGIAIALIVVEVSTVDLVAIWFALSALIMGVVTGIATDLEVVWQVVIFVALSSAFLVATRPFVKKIMQRRKGSETNLELVVGHTALVVEKIENEYGRGAVKINGLVWSARSVSGDAIEKDELVTVKEIQGNKVFVERK